MTSIAFITCQTFKTITMITLNAKYKIFQNGDVIFLRLTKNERKSNILLVEVNGDACVDPHNKKGEARQEEQL